MAAEPSAQPPSKPSGSPPAGDPLELFHPRIAAWFRDRVGTPTDVQAKAWPEIAAGRHVLVTAPTGSGKTLTAFLWAVHQLMTGAWEPGGVRVLYVSPLKALNNDIRRNLLGPLEELEAACAAAGEVPPGIRVATRSGDTPEDERRRMLRQPPEILITTPESLNILLTSKGGRSMLGGVETVILDEIHAVAGSKRGTHLITAVDRLTLLSGEFQRLALSATIRPLPRIARFVGGWRVDRLDEDAAEAVYTPRPVSIVEGGAGKRYDLSVAFPVEAAAGEPTAAAEALRLRPDALEDGLPANFWEVLTEDFKRRIRQNRSTLLFANSRRMTEKVTRFLNDGEPTDLAYSHHGSLSREIRSVVEERLKAGRLAAIVATNSLELGIDIGSLDEVLLIQTPPSVASAVQRIGRAGHGVGEVSRGRLYPTFGRDFLDAAVMVRAVLDGDVEEVEPIVGSLDVLAQVVLSMTVADAWTLDGLYRFLRSTYPYRELGRRAFDLVLEMLAGRWADTRLRELKPRVRIDKIDGTVTARRGADRLLYRSGGTIPDRGYYHLRLHDSGAKIGELDEEFVWERSVGDTFALGAQSWRIRHITHNDVLVAPARKGAAMAPFWRAEARDRGFFLSEKIGGFLEVAEEMLAAKGGAADLTARLLGEHALEKAAAEQLVGLLERQRAATGVALPGRRHLVVEHVRGRQTDGLDGREGSLGDSREIILHTFWGGRVNRPFGLALSAAAEDLGLEIEILHDDDCLLLRLPPVEEPGASLEALLGRVAPHDLEELLRRRLEGTGFFGARFRENAGRALLLPRAGFDKRVPLWLNRLRSKKLLEKVSRHGDFPLLVETWRTCLRDEFDLASLSRVLGELAAGEIRLTEIHTEQLSPFAANLAWKQTNRLMYEDDTPESAGRGGSALAGDLLRELVFSSRLRPRLPAELLDRFQRKLHRTWPGYAPQSAEDLLDWIGERLLIPEPEWRRLLAAVERDAGVDAAALDGWLASLAGKAVRLTPPGAVVAVQALPRLLEVLDPDARAVRLELLSRGPVEVPDEDATAREALAGLLAGRRRRGGAGGEGDPLSELLGEWIRFYGPFRRELLTEALGLDEERVRDALETLLDEERIVIDDFRRQGETDGADGRVEATAQAAEGALRESQAREPEARDLEICDAENLEILLRLLRAEARPSFEALPLDRLPLFLATHQGLAGTTAGEGGLGDLRQALERLFGYPAPAALWETDLLPARLAPYYPSWLDTLMQESDLIWLGTGRERLTFLFGSDLDLLGGGGNTPTAAGEATELFPRQAGRFALEDLAEHTGLDSAELTRRLWELAWAGRVTNSTFLAVRRGILTRFTPLDEAPARAAPRWASRRGGAVAKRRAFDRWKASRPLAGDWSLAEEPLAEEELDALEREELARDRVRLLLRRYGLLFRELIARELPALRWAPLFRTLRRMELSGEVVSGHFFDGIPGLQFLAPTALRALRERGLAEDVIYWMNALDPASPCGLGLPDLKGELPPRLPSSHLAYHGDRLVVLSRRNGAELEIRVGADHPHLLDYLGFLKVLLTRDFHPQKLVEVELINGEEAAASPYAPRLAEAFSTSRELKSLRLRRRY